MKIEYIRHRLFDEIKVDGKRYIEGNPLFDGLQNMIKQKLPEDYLKFQISNKRRWDIPVRHVKR